MLKPNFRAKAWSLSSFLWNKADADGRPTYREGFLRLLKDSLRVRQTVTKTGALQTQAISAADFRKTLALESPERYAAFEKDWIAWETALLAKSVRPEWTAKRDERFAQLGIK
jgi:hypothetical protein